MQFLLLIWDTHVLIKLSPTSTYHLQQAKDLAVDGLCIAFAWIRLPIKTVSENGMQTLLFKELFIAIYYILNSLECSCWEIATILKILLMFSR